MRQLIYARVHDYYWHQDLNCAITTLKILSEIFGVGLHPQVFEAAFGLNGGRCGSQCGLVEGALMFIGVYGKQKGLDQSEIKGLCYKFSHSFQHNFSSLLCSELRPQGFSPNNPPHLCESRTKQAVMFSIDFITIEINNNG